MHFFRPGLRRRTFGLLGHAHTFEDGGIDSHSNPNLFSLPYHDDRLTHQDDVYQLFTPIPRVASSLSHKPPAPIIEVFFPFTIRDILIREETKSPPLLLFLWFDSLGYPLPPVTFLRPRTARIGILEYPEAFSGIRSAQPLTKGATRKKKVLIEVLHTYRVTSGVVAWLEERYGTQG
ncbi:hypothetical protein SISSUDRAFT_681648 [Sistotremastrum suecicum HHB10207 ss-3]|uniref:Uncharacterized protein n=1 Tax=Sistotremastrum suecicum HHB10207 ss-3 TaxID=1314776 RepID=A0A166I0N7_9AGAM|nr:hypothetical protein SISSUDRAFT_681648 [Sistotremastrum suecicum HHB10207 ss-3]